MARHFNSGMLFGFWLFIIPYYLLRRVDAGTLWVLCLPPSEGCGEKKKGLNSLERWEMQWSWEGYAWRTESREIWRLIWNRETKRKKKKKDDPVYACQRETLKNTYSLWLKNSASSLVMTYNRLPHYSLPSETISESITFLNMSGFSSLCFQTAWCLYFNYHIYYLLIY